MSKHYFNFITSSSGRFLVTQTLGSNAGGLIGKEETFVKENLLSGVEISQTFNCQNQLVIIQTNSQIMNVLNKIKSKKNKEQNSQLLNVLQKQQAQREVLPETQSVKNQKPSKKTTESKPQLISQQKSSSFVDDLDELNVAEYYTRKQKKMQMMNRIQSSDTFNEKYLKSSSFCINVKKCYTIGDICVVQGQLVHQKDGKQVYRKKTKFSCSLDTIPFPDTISRILLNKVTMLTNQQGIFVAQNIDKLIEKSNIKK